MTNPLHDYYDHPVFNPACLHIDTPAMDKLKEDVHRWLWTGATGGLILGSARAGKTTAILDLSKQLYTRGNKSIPSYYVSIPSRDQKTIMSVFRQLCLKFNLRVTSIDRADNLSNRFTQYISENAAKAQCQQAVLFVDEMQRLIPNQLNAFAELYDDLLILGVFLTVIFVGNEQESSALLKVISKPEYSHLRGRFFTQRSTFLGLTSEKEVRHCLSQYDTLRYPLPGGPTYTEYFIEEAKKNGWCLVSLSADLWRVFRGYQKDYHFASWGMQYFTATINILLTDYLPKYHVENYDEDMIHECINTSGLIASEVTQIHETVSH